MYKLFFKRFFDIIISAGALILFFPVFLFLIVTLYFANKNAGVFFVQIRPGKKEKLFKLVKFKTMTDQRNDKGDLLPDSERITKIGKFIRSTSLDELPQFINVLKGDMSLIGPRPLLVQYLPLYNEKQIRRHEVRPGITGWAQVNGRNTISWQQKFEFDVWYVDHVSFTLDLKILFKSIYKVLHREGINTDNNTAMDFFTGNN